MAHSLPIGKLPLDLLTQILQNAPVQDPRVRLGPGIGLDCAVIDLGETTLVIKSDPITFATDAIGWYAVQINANDIATTGATPRWFTAVVMLPGNRATDEMALQISEQLFSACRELGISVIGGHTEITYGIDRPLISGTLIGETTREALITPRGAQVGDRLLLTKGIPIEATAIIAREFPQKLTPFLSADEIRLAADFLHHPGISILRDAQIAVQAGRVKAMHDPTEGGLAGALWELAEACGHTLTIELDSIHIPELSGRICRAFNLDPLGTIASGALLMAVDAASVTPILHTLQAEGIFCSEIGVIETGPVQVWKSMQGKRSLLERPSRDEITRLYE